MTSKGLFLFHAARWLLLFLVLVVAPLFLALIGHTEEYRGFWVEFGVGLGFVGLAMMGLQFLLTARYSRIAAPFGIDELLQFHGMAGYFAWAFIMLHFIILFLADSQFLEFLDPRVNFLRALALSAVIVAITVLIATTHWREKFGIVYEWWRLSHGLLGLFVVFVGTVHIMQVSFYVSELWQQMVWAGMTMGVITLLLHNRVWRPWQMKKCPWRVKKVKKEVDETWSLELEPVGHDGIEFKGGQFVWITLGNSPFSLQQHPFTISSSPEREGIRLTIKELGDFTSKIPEIQPGSTVFIEGPYGNFTLEVSTSEHNVFIVGGIGITPTMSILEAMRDRQDRREVTVFFGAPKLELVPFLDELRALEAELNMKLVIVLEEASDDWEGETGFITGDILKRHLPGKVTTFEYFICGPPPMMDVAESTLREWRVPVHKVHSERFNIV